MRSKKRIGQGMALAAVLAALATGCQTTAKVPVSYTEPAKVNFDGVSKIGIVSNNSEAETYITNVLTTGTGRYTIATAEEMVELGKWQEQQSLLADGVETSPANLVKEYNANPVRADGNYDGKWLKVTGAVTDFKSGAVRLGVGGDSVDVYIIRSELGKVADLNKGDTITVIGRCSGLKPPYSDGITEILDILGGGGNHVNLSGARFFIPEYTGPVDALLELNETHSEEIESRETKEPIIKEDGTEAKDAEGKTVYRPVTEYRKLVAVTLEYKAVDARNGTSLGKGSQSHKTSTDFNKDKSKLTATPALVSQVLRTPLGKIKNDMVPTRVTLSIKLAKSDTKDKVLTAALNEAAKLAKAKDYAAAAKAYGEIYADSKDFAAGYNQAVLTEVAHGAEKAIVLMQELVKASDNPEAKTMLGQMQGRNSANARSAAQMGK